jgi:hypothetical protein
MWTSKVLTFLKFTIMRRVVHQSYTTSGHQTPMPISLLSTGRNQRLIHALLRANKSQTAKDRTRGAKYIKISTRLKEENPNRALVLAAKTEQ